MYKGALVDFDNADRLQPNNAWTLKTRGETKRQLADFKGSLVDLILFNRLQPNDAFTLEQLDLTKKAIEKAGISALEGQVSNLSVAATAPNEGCTVFLSYRVAEADREAREVKRRLEAKGVPTFVSSMDVPTGANWRREIAKNLKSCKVLIALGNRTYGVERTTSQGTLEELTIAKEYKRTVLVIQMCDQYDEIEAAMELRGLNALGRWTVGSPMPSDLEASLLANLRKLGISV